MRTARLAVLASVAAIAVALCCASAAFGWQGYGKNPPTKLPQYPENGCACHAGDAWAYYDNTPHRGFTASSDKCDVCHTLHDASGDLHLLFADTVVDTCRECHDGTGGGDVYMLTSRGLTPASGHRSLTPTANVVPGGDGATGGPVTRVFKGTGGYLVCVDCHSVHNSNTVDDFRTNGNYEWCNMLLKQRPTSAVATVAAYGSDWCAGCHAGRLSGGAVHNHPADSLQTRSDPFTVVNVVVPKSSLPVGIAVGSDGSVYVADKGNLRIQRFDSSGGYLASWDDSGTTGLAIDSSGHLNAVVSQYGPIVVDVINQYTTGGAFVRRISQPTGWGARIVSVAAGNSKVYFTGQGNRGLGWMNDDGTSAGYTYSFMITPTVSPIGLAVAADGRIWCADVAAGVLRVVIPGGSYTTGPVYGSAGSGPGQFSIPLALAPVPGGGMYVADSGNDRVQQIDGSGAFVRQWGTSGTGDGQFDKPEGIAVGPDGSVYVADAGNSRIQKFTSAGVFVAKWGSAGSGAGQFDFVESQAVPEMSTLWYRPEGHLMPMPRDPLQQGHAPICQQCHSDAMDPGQVGSNGIVSLNGYMVDYLPGYSPFNNPQYRMAFPHESPNPTLLIETNDNLCLNCHPAGALP